MNTPDSSLDAPPNGGQYALISNFPNGVLVLFDADLHYRIVGPDVLPVSCRRSIEMVGKSVEDIFPEETANQLAPKLHATLKGEAQSFDLEYDGEVHHLETRPTMINNVPYGVLVTQVVTKERQTADELRQQTERLDQFASMISHDLRNPLSIALGRLDLYRETGDESHLDSVEKALNRIDELTTSLMALARHQEPATEPEAASVSDIATQAWEMVDTRSATLSAKDAPIIGDTGQLQALFENLFRNAVGHGGGDVTVRVGPLENGFFVEDTGKGIPPEKRDQVFGYGFTTGYSGNGIGLTIVHQIARTHDFDVSLSEGPEGGARFEFERNISTID